VGPCCCCLPSDLRPRARITRCRRTCRCFSRRVTSPGGQRGKEEFLLHTNLDRTRFTGHGPFPAEKRTTSQHIFLEIKNVIGTRCSCWSTIPQERQLPLIPTVALSRHARRSVQFVHFKEKENPCAPEMDRPSSLRWLLSRLGRPMWRSTLYGHKIVNGLADEAIDLGGKWKQLRCDWSSFISRLTGQQLT
jgi:hypothetical protein